MKPQLKGRWGALLSGNLLVLVSATIVNAGNYLFNLVMGRWLGPVGFADLSLIVTIFLILSFFAAALQTPAAKFAAVYTAGNDPSGLADLRHLLYRLAIPLGLGVAALLVLCAPILTAFFSTQSPWIFVLFGLFVPFYLLQGIDRGLLQGQTRFVRLALSYQSEMWSRLALGVLLVAVGWGVHGAVMAIGLSFVATWLVARTVAATLPKAVGHAVALRRGLVGFAMPVLSAQIGQILISNSDILIVRRFFAADEAGQYAALALIGRIVFFATWSVVVVMFPLVAQRHHRAQPTRPLLYLSLAAVLGVGGGVVALVALFPEQVVIALFGPAYLSIAPLLWLYSSATLFFALANVVVQYNLSIDRRGGTYLAIVAGVAQVVLLVFFHASLTQVVMVQLWLMAGLLALLAGWDALPKRPAHGGT